MKILFINFSDKGGGAEQFSYDLYKATPNASMIVKNASKSSISQIPNSALHPLACLLNKVIQKFTRYKSLTHLLGMQENFHWTHAGLKKSNIYKESDIVHLNNIHGDWFDLSAIKYLDRNKPIIWTLHDMWCMTGGEAYTFNHQGFKTGDWNTPYIMNYPISSPLLDNRRYYLNKKKRLYKNLNQTTFVAVSDWLANCLKDSFVYNEKLNVITIKNGVNLKIFNCQGRINNHIKPHVLYFNNKSPFKGHKIAHKVLQSEDSDFQLTVVGDEIPNLKNVDYISNRVDSREDLANLYRRSDILLFPSTAENMPLTVLEAMACGMSVVAMPVGGIPEIITNGKTGFLARNVSRIEFGEAFKTSLKANNQSIGYSAYNFICTNHDEKKMQKAYHDLYNKIISRSQ